MKIYYSWNGPSLSAQSNTAVDTLLEKTVAILNPDEQCKVIRIVSSETFDLATPTAIQYTLDSIFDKQPLRRLDPYGENYKKIELYQREINNTQLYSHCEDSFDSETDDTPEEQASRVKYFTDLLGKCNKKLGYSWFQEIHKNRFVDKMPSAFQAKQKRF